jgi:hypothetical protein
MYNYGKERDTEGQSYDLLALTDAEQTEVTAPQ